MANARTTTARRYAEAAFEIAQRDGTTDRWLKELERLASAVADQGVVRRLEDPEIPIERRQLAFRSLFPAEEQMLPQVWNLVGLVLRRRRLDTLVNIYEGFKRLYNKREGIHEAVATSAAPLDDAEVAAVRARLEQITGGRIDLSLRVDPQLLGGVQVRLGDLLIDGSVRGRLERLRGRLAAGSITP